jgi:XTP/dITP diphosphohydrolase
VIALVDPFEDGQKPAIVDGRCEGAIARSARGESRFGYDPLFIVAGGQRTFAELGEVEKNTISHRGQAARALLPRVQAIVEARLSEARRITAARGAA